MEAVGAHEALDLPVGGAEAGADPQVLGATTRRGAGSGLDPSRLEAGDEAPPAASRGPGDRGGRRRGRQRGWGVLAFEALVAELGGEALDDPVDDVEHRGAGPEQLGDRRDALVANPAGDDPLEHRQVRIDVQGEPVAGPVPGDPDANGGDLLVADPDAGPPVDAPGRDAEVGERADEDLLELAHVSDDVADPGAGSGDGDDRVADQLAGPVVGDVAAPVGLHQPRADRGRGDEHVGRVGAGAEGEDVVVLEQQESVDRAPSVEGPLEEVCFVVADVSEPSDPQQVSAQASSASQLRVSRSVRSASRNEAA